MSLDERASLSDVHARTVCRRRSHRPIHRSCRPRARGPLPRRDRPARSGNARRRGIASSRSSIWSTSTLARRRDAWAPAAPHSRICARMPTRGCCARRAHTTHRTERHFAIGPTARSATRSRRGSANGPTFRAIDLDTARRMIRPSPDATFTRRVHPRRRAPRCRPIGGLPPWPSRLTRRMKTSWPIPAPSPSRWCRDGSSRTGCVKRSLACPNPSGRCSSATTTAERRSSRSRRLSVSPDRGPAACASAPSRGSPANSVASGRGPFESASRSLCVRAPRKRPLLGARTQAIRPPRLQSPGRSLPARSQERDTLGSPSGTSRRGSTYTPNRRSYWGTG